MSAISGRIAKFRPGRTEGVLALALAGIATGSALWLAGLGDVASWAWAATTLVALVPLTMSIFRQLLRREFGVDVIALLAMAGSLLLGQELAGAVIALMLSGGDSLERFAGRHGTRELAAFVERAPKVVHRYLDSGLEEPALESVRQGDRLLVKPGEVVPVDGVVSGAAALLDESALTGEARLVIDAWP